MRDIRKGSVWKCLIFRAIGNKWRRIDYGRQAREILPGNFGPVQFSTEPASKYFLCASIEGKPDRTAGALALRTGEPIPKSNN